MGAFAVNPRIWLVIALVFAVFFAIRWFRSLRARWRSRSSSGRSGHTVKRPYPPR